MIPTPEQTTLIPPSPTRTATGHSRTPRHILGIEDLASNMGSLIHDAIALKVAAQRGNMPRPLTGKTVLVLFERNSTRTRVSFEVGIQRLGGISVILDSQGSQLERGESLEDTARVLSRYADCIVHRARSHDDLAEIAKHATVPVVNALTDREHPCQVLADLVTLHEHFGDLAGRSMAYVGDGNNMAHSYLLAAPLCGMDIRIATPPGFEPDPSIVARAKTLARNAGTQVMVTHDPVEAVKDADAVATDTWISMGDEAEAQERLAAFASFTVDDDMMDHAAPGAVFLHCLPGHWGHEATHEVAHGPRSLIYEEAENRMWSQMALLARLID